MKKSEQGGQKTLMDLGGFGPPREMARLTVWSVNKAGCMAIAVLCV